VRVVDSQPLPADEGVGFGAAGGGDGTVEPVAERRYEFRRPGDTST
jgi:hypothetical protein